MVVKCEQSLCIIFFTIFASAMKPRFGVPAACVAFKLSLAQSQVVMRFIGLDNINFSLKVFYLISQIHAYISTVSDCLVSANYITCKI